MARRVREDSAAHSTDWTVPQDARDYTALRAELSNAAAACSDVVDLFRACKDPALLESCADLVSRVGEAGSVLCDHADDCSDAAERITGCAEAVEELRVEHNGTRSARKRANASRAAEDARTDYEAGMESLMRATLSGAVTDVRADELARMAATAVDQDGAVVLSPTHTRATAAEELARMAETAVRRGESVAVITDTGAPARSPLATLPGAQAHAHRILAAVSRELTRCGWHGPTAVAIIERTVGEDVERRTVYTTSEGVAMLPAGMRLPVGTYPLHIGVAADYDNVWEALRACDGYAYPMAKLWSVIADPWSVKGVATTDVADPNLAYDDAAVQDSALTAALVSAGEVPVCSVERANLATVLPYQTTAVFNRAKPLALGDAAPPSLDEAHDELVSTRWLGESPGHLYHAAHVRLLLSDAYTSLRAGNPADAAYPLTELEMMG